ncbi:MAG: T9SS type A sorting domain-containing protein, partial [Vicingaceae bacterium]
YFFTIGSVNGAIAPLPVELISFNANCLNNEVAIKWTTASEINNDYFTIERSLDGINFDKIGNVTGAGNSNSLKDYSWIDEKPLSGSNYYRLKQTDFDGKFSYSDVKTAGCNENVQFGVYPNPTSNTVTLSFSSETKIQYQIVSLDGRVIQDGDFIRNKKLDLSELSNGVYFVRAYSVNEIFQEKLIKQ